MGNSKRSISILSANYEISITSGLAESHNAAGLCDPNSSKITIDEALSPTQFAKTMLHEICHAWQFESGLHEVLNEQSSEFVAQTFALVVTEILKNRSLLKKP